MTAPITFRWNGEAMEPATGFWFAKANKEFVVGETYPMVEHHEASGKSRGHYFASIADAHGNLPDEMLDAYPTKEHLRKKALIFKGWREERLHPCRTEGEAQRLAAFVKPMDDFAVITVRDAVVRVWTAKSQSAKAMGAKDFQRSKQDVLDFCDDLLGVERGETARNQAA